MAHITTAQITDRKTWESFLKQHSEANFLQSWYWGEFHKALDHKVMRIGFYIDNTLAGVMLSIVEKAKRGTYLTVPAGPIIDWKNKTLIKSFHDEVLKIAKENDCSFIRVRPQLISDDFSKKIFTSLGFRTAPMHLHAELTNQLDITKSEDELLTQMRKATRYEIKKAIKIGVRVEKSTSTSDIKKFYDLQIETSKRQGFVPFSFKFLDQQFQIFYKADSAILYSSYFEKKLLAQAFIIFYGDEAVYHYGASTPDGRVYPGAYLIQWQAILEAKKRGISKYNFWGVAPVGHRFANLSVFKKGFGGEDFEYLHAQDLVVNYPKYAMNYVVEIIRKKLRRV